jgi:hypothetical protein
MPDSNARAYLTVAKDALKKWPPASPTDLALIYATLAQAEATVEVADLLRSGIGLRQGEHLARAMEDLAGRLPER